MIRSIVLIFLIRIFSICAFMVVLSWMLVAVVDIDEHGNIQLEDVWTSMLTDQSMIRTATVSCSIRGIRRFFCCQAYCEQFIHQFESNILSLNLLIESILFIVSAFSCLSAPLRRSPDNVSFQLERGLSVKAATLIGNRVCWLNSHNCGQKCRKFLSDQQAQQNRFTRRISIHPPNQSHGIQIKTQPKILHLLKDWLA